MNPDEGKNWSDTCGSNQANNDFFVDVLAFAIDQWNDEEKNRLSENEYLSMKFIDRWLD